MGVLLCSGPCASSKGLLGHLDICLWEMSGILYGVLETGFSVHHEGHQSKSWHSSLDYSFSQMLSESLYSVKKDLCPPVQGVKERMDGWRRGGAIYNLFGGVLSVSQHVRSYLRFSYVLSEKN